MKYTHWSKQFINGAYVDGGSGSTFVNENPFNGEALAEIKLATNADIDEAYEAARKAQIEWGQTPAYQRMQIMDNAANILMRRRDEILALIVEETGGNFIKAAIDVDSSIGIMKETASYPLRMTGEILPSIIPGKENRIYRNPIGVAGIISPWNFPFYLSMRAVAPALAAGNGVVLKPDNQTFVTGGLVIADIYEEAGLPKGLLNVVVADLAEIGDYFVEHPVPRVISFTGSTAAGKHIASVAAGQLKKLALELGGNSAFIVLDDADIENAASAAAFGKYLHQGQICMAINRIIVDRKVYSQFVDVFKEKVSKLKVGNPLEAETFIGPMINRKQVDKVLNMIEKTVEAGATVCLRGAVNNNMMEPVILIDAKPEMDIVQNEIFGPVAVIIPVDSEEEAIEVANNSKSGLSGAVFAGSIDRGVRVAKRIHTGMIHVNDQCVHDEPLIAFGGEKDSGLGRYGGRWSLDEFTTMKWISVQEEPRPYGI